MLGVEYNYSQTCYVIVLYSNAINSWWSSSLKGLDPKAAAVSVSTLQKYPAASLISHCTSHWTRVQLLLTQSPNAKLSQLTS